MLKTLTCLFMAVGVLSGCAMTNQHPAAVSVASAGEPAMESAHVTADLQKITELERQLSREQRQCAADKRRLEAAVKESQKQGEDLQKKLDALLSIDRDLRNRNRSR